MLDKKDEIVHHRGDKIEIRLITTQPQNIASFVSERLGFDTADIGIAAVAPGGAVTVSLDSVDLMEHFGIDPDMPHINDVQRKSGSNDKSR
jgi:hypothetical protein